MTPDTHREQQIVRPRLGFLGVGWIGRQRLEALVRSQLVQVVAIADPVRTLAEQAQCVVPEAVLCEDLDALLTMELEGIVIATPSALHAEQAMAVLARGLAVFCQKPLGRTAAETRCVVDAAHSADRLLAVDMSYRFLCGMQTIRMLVQAGEIGDIYAVELVFHNAYGPDKAWFYDPVQSGGGCVIDLGIHLVDLALWTLNFPRVTRITSRLFAHGALLEAGLQSVEDYALAWLDLDTGATVSLTCSWRLPVGCDAVIAASFYGTQGSLRLRNVSGSFYDFTADRCRGTVRETLQAPPDAWGGRAAVAWVQRLVVNKSYDSEVERVVTVAEVLDAIYGCARGT